MGSKECRSTVLVWFSEGNGGRVLVRRCKTAGLSDRLLSQHLLVLFLAKRCRQGEVQHFMNGLHVMNVQVLELLWREVLFHVHLVFRREDYVVNSGPLCSQNF